MCVCVCCSIHCMSGPFATHSKSRRILIISYSKIGFCFYSNGLVPVYLFETTIGMLTIIMDRMWLRKSIDEWEKMSEIMVCWFFSFVAVFNRQKKNTHTKMSFDVPTVESKKKKLLSIVKCLNWEQIFVWIWFRKMSNVQQIHAHCTYTYDCTFRTCASPTHLCLHGSTFGIMLVRISSWSMDMGKMNAGERLFRVLSKNQCKKWEKWS